MNPLEHIFVENEYKLEHERLRLEEERLKVEEKHFQKEREWAEQDSKFRALQREWRKLDDKRRRVTEKMAQLSLLAKLSALLGGFQVAMYINQGMPGLDEVWAAAMPASVNGTPDGSASQLAKTSEQIGCSKATREGGGESVWSSNPLLNDGILALWAISCVLVIVVNLCIMTMSALLQLYVVQKTYEEPDLSQYGKDTSKMRQRSRYTDDPVNGIIATQDDFSRFWDQACDNKYILLLRAFSCGMPLYFVSLALAAVIKFYMSPWAACLSVVPAIVASGVWFHYHRILLSQVVFRPSTEVFDEQGAWQGGGKSPWSMPESPPQPSQRPPSSSLFHSHPSPGAHLGEHGGPLPDREPEEQDARGGDDGRLTENEHAGVEEGEKRDDARDRLSAKGDHQMLTGDSQEDATQ